MKRKILAVAAAAVIATHAPAVTPGPQADGSVLLHNQWSIRPAGDQVPLGEFPVAIALHPDGKYAAVLHSGYGPHELWLVDLPAKQVVSVTKIRISFDGLSFTRNGHKLLCSGGADRALKVFDFDDGHLSPEADIPVPDRAPFAAVSGVAAGRDADTAYVSVLFSSRVARIDLSSRSVVWESDVDAGAAPSAVAPPEGPLAPNSEMPFSLQTSSQPFGLTEDPRRHRVYVALWGKSAVLALDARDGHPVARWPVGLHPNQVLLSRDGVRLFVANGGGQGVSILDPDTGQVQETLRSDCRADDPPGATPDALALDAGERRLYVANGYANNVAVFDVSDIGHAASLGFIPTGWDPFALALTPEAERLLIVNARGLSARANAAPPTDLTSHFPPVKMNHITPGPGGPMLHFPYVGSIYQGSLGIVELPKSDQRFDAALRHWTEQSAMCRPRPPPRTERTQLPLRYVIYIIKENRTYDEVFGDVKGGNGDPSLCIFPEKATPNLHRLANQFVLLDNFYANSEVSASGHEWSMAAYDSEFVERIWPVNYGHLNAGMPYPGEGGYEAAIPAHGYLWDRAREAGVSFRDYGEFVHRRGAAGGPQVSNLPGLKGVVDPGYPGWDLAISDVARSDRFIAELRRMDRAGRMPRLQIVRLPNDHTEAGKAGALSPRAFVAQNDFALGRVVEAVSHSRFWPQTAIFVVEDDAQNGPDHVDAHRTEALVISPYVKHGFVDSTPYTTCSMLASIEHILRLPPMSLFDQLATPMAESFGTTADLSPYSALPPRVSLTERNPGSTQAAAAAAHFDFSQEDRIEDQAFNRAIWLAVKGDGAVMPAPVHAAFARSFPSGDDGD